MTKILIDLVGAPFQSGGVEVWARELIHSWAEEFPKDQLTIVCDPRVLEGASLPRNFIVVAVGSQSQARRALLQFFFVPFVFFRGKFDRLFSINSVFSPFLVRRKVTIMNHDWRHLRRPSEFSLAQRLYRVVWKWCTRNSREVISISSKTADETAMYTGRNSTFVVHPGGNHLDRVVGDSDVERYLANEPFLLAFAQHTNKRPELVLDALACLAKLGKQPVPKLVLLGVRGAARETLKRQANEYELSDRLVPYEFVSQADYAWLVRNAACVVLLSTDEGYSIPIAEASSCGTPVLASEVSGVGENLHRGLRTVSDDPESIAVHLRSILAEGRARPKSYSSWSETVKFVREIVVNGKR